ncbi:MAG TPA: hypothetical protein DCY88_33255 [Cyanobacteria bacterium UBA11372]|nr:hypothetical protein [Cyanobacteria bacterium UBA11372]
MKLPRIPIMPITWVLVNLITYPAPIWANSPGLVNNLLQTKQTAQEKPDFSGDGRSGRRTGGGSRSPCISKEPPLTALSPINNSGKTVLEHPTFWFYVPYSAQEAPQGEFVLQEEGGKDIYRIGFTLPGKPGFVSVSIPPTQPVLEINKWYRWYFKIYCEPQQSSAPNFVEGWVQRVELTKALQSQLQQATPRKYAAYAANLIWYDAIDDLAKLRLVQPSNTTLDNDWDNLLKSREIDLQGISREPIVGSVILSRR